MQDIDEIVNIWAIETSDGECGRIIITGEEWFFSLEQALKKSKTCSFIKTTGFVGTEEEVSLL